LTQLKGAALAKRILAWDHRVVGSNFKLLHLQEIINSMPSDKVYLSKRLSFKYSKWEESISSGLDMNILIS